MDRFNRDSAPPWSAFGAMRRIQVRALGYDAQPAQRWTSWVLDDSPDCLVTYRPPQGPVFRPRQITWPNPAPAITLFWPARCYHLSYLLDGESQLWGYYAGITSPPIRRPGYLEYMGMALGLVVDPDLTYTVDGQGAGPAHRAALHRQTQDALQQVIGLVETRDPLFRPPERWLAALEHAESDPLAEIAAMVR
jgi:hypothetical protein